MYGYKQYIEVIIKIRKDSFSFNGIIPDEMALLK